MNEFRTGTVTGTGAAINVELGWKPDWVKVVNATDGNAADEWYNGMTAATSISYTSASIATRATNGISQYNGSSTVGAGFTIGSGISTNTKTLYWIALRNAD